MLVPEINCGMPYLKYVKFNVAITELKLRVFYTCIKAKLPPIIFHCSLVESMLPRFAYEKKGKVNIQKISNLEIISD